MAVAAQPTRPTQKAAVRTPTPCVLEQRVARVAVKLATLELMELGVVSALIITARVCVRMSVSIPQWSMVWTQKVRPFPWQFTPDSFFGPSYQLGPGYIRLA